MYRFAAVQGYCRNPAFPENAKQNAKIDNHIHSQNLCKTQGKYKILWPYALILFPILRDIMAILNIMATREWWICVARRQVLGVHLLNIIY